MSKIYKDYVIEMNKIKEQLEYIRSKLTRITRTYLLGEVRNTIYKLDDIVKKSIPATIEVYKGYDDRNLFSEKYKNNCLRSYEAMVIYYELFYELYAIYDKDSGPSSFEILTRPFFIKHYPKQYEEYQKINIEQTRQGIVNLVGLMGYIASEDSSVFTKVIDRYNKYEKEYLVDMFNLKTSHVDRKLPYPMNKGAGNKR